MSFVPTKLYILFQWQSKVVDLVDPIPSLISIYFLCIMKLVLVLNIDEILLVERKTIINQSINQSIPVTGNLNFMVKISVYFIPAN